MDGELRDRRDPPITRTLARVAQGEQGAADALATLVYPELKALARQRLGNFRAGRSLQPTALVHEAWLRLCKREGQAFENRCHYFGAAAVAMRDVLVEDLRRQGREKRGGGAQREPLTTRVGAPDASDPVDLLDLEAALSELEREHERPARVVTLKFFGGLSNEEVAVALGVGPRTVDRDWAFARAWLRRAIGKAQAD